MKRRINSKYLVVIEQSKNGYGAYVPDLPGCVALGDSLAEVERLIREAIELHIEGLQADGAAVPAPTTRSEYISARVA